MSAVQVYVRAQHNKDNPYFPVCRKTAQDREITFEARGLLLYVLSHSDDWKINLEDLYQNCGRDRVQRILKELRENRYAERVEKRRPDGTFEYEFLVYEERQPPLTENPSPGNPLTENPLAVEGEQPLTENPQHNKKKGSDKNKTARSSAQGGHLAKTLPVRDENGRFIKRDPQPRRAKQAKPAQQPPEPSEDDDMPPVDADPPDRPRNALYDAIYEVWGYAGSMNGAMQKMLSGTATKAGWKEGNITPPLTPGELRTWAAWYRKTELRDDPELNMLEDRMKIQSSVMRWRSLGKPSGISSVMRSVGIANGAAFDYWQPGWNPEQIAEGAY